MQENAEYLRQELLKKVTTGVVVANAILSLALFHYTAWIVYKLWEFFT